MDASPQNTVFSRKFFLNALAVGHRTYILSRNSEPVLGVIVIDKLADGTKAFYTGGVYQGIAFAPNKKESVHGETALRIAAVQALIERMSERFEEIEFCLHYSISDLRAFKWFNYKTPELGQFAIDIDYTGIVTLDHAKPFDMYLNTIRSSRKQDYKKAVKSGFLVEEYDDFAVFENLYRKTFGRQGVAVSDQFMMATARVIRAAIEVGNGRFTLCRSPKGEPVSTAFFLHDRGAAYYMLGATDPEFRNDGVGTQIIIENIRYYAEGRSIVTIDMLGVNSPNRGDYKISFNASVRPYYSVRWRRRA